MRWYGFFSASIALVIAVGCNEMHAGPLSPRESGSPLPMIHGEDTSPTPIYSSPAQVIVPSASPTPIPSVGVCGPGECGTVVRGTVTDQEGERLDGVKITAKLLSSGTFTNGSDTVVAISVVGSYSINGVPLRSYDDSGKVSPTKILLTTSKSGFEPWQSIVSIDPSNANSSTVANVVLSPTP